MNDKYLSRVNGHLIYVDQLKRGHVEKIQEQIDPGFLDIHEKDLGFVDPIYVKGEAYIAEQELVLHLHVSTFANIACAICNEPVKVPLTLKDFYYTEELKEIKGGTFSILNPLREAILLETPTFAECEGKCPQRKELEKYFKNPASSNENGDETYRPFEGLKLD